MKASAGSNPVNAALKARIINLKFKIIMNDDILKGLGAMLLVILIATIVAFFSGTILYLTYDHIHALFPTAAEKGIIAKDLGWWDSVCVAWIFIVLIKRISIRRTKKDD